MKVLVLHPPMYPVNYKFYNLLGKKVSLTVIQFGEHPVHHTSWNIHNYEKDDLNYKLVIIGKGAVSMRTQMSLSYLKYFFKEKPDIVLSIAFWFPSFLMSFFRFFFKFKFIILTNVIDHTEINISKSKLVIRKFIAKRVDVFIAASSITKDYLLNKYNKAKVIISIQTIDVNLWINEYEKLPEKQVLREEFNLPTDKTIMLGVGNFTEKKNWKLVLSNIKLSNDIHFLLIGSGQQRNEYIDFISNLRIESKVTILSRKDEFEIKKYYKASDFLVFPSKFDQFGFVVPEALSFRLPVICSKNTGASILIKNGYNGFVIDPSKEINGYINSIVKNLAEMQANSINSIKNLKLENRVSEFVNIFNSLK